jgi:CrcB protein
MGLNILIVGLGGFLGAVARYGVGHWVGQHLGRTFPWGTMAVNVSGTFLIGLVIGISAARHLENPLWRLFLAVGFLGAYTTFSTFEFETGELLKDGATLMAAANVGGSVMAGFLALRLGEAVARVI